jgi:hypothetical protein
MKKVFYTLLLITGCATIKNQQKGEPILTKSRPIQFSIRSNFQQDSLETVFIGWFKNLGYKNLTNDELTALIPTKSKLMGSRLYEIQKKARDKNDLEQKTKQWMKDENNSYCSNVHVNLHIKIDSLTNKYFVDSANINTIPFPFADFQNYKKYPKFIISQSQLKTKSLQNVLTMLVDSITLPRNRKGQILPRYE